MVGVAAIGTFGLAANAKAQEATSLASNLNLLSAILGAAIADAPGPDLRVDPRPMMANARYTTVQSEAMLSISGTVWRRRAAVIRAAGLHTVDATRVGQSKVCPGTLVLGHTDSLGISHTHEGCPVKSFSTLVIGLPRPGVKVLRQNEVYDLDTESVARGYWAARVIRTSLASVGSVVLAADYVLTREGGRWKVVKIVGLMYTE